MLQFEAHGTPTLSPPRERRRPGLRYRTGLILAPLALHLAPVTAADTRWTGASGAPYWDLTGNWSAGVPQARDTLVLLGDSHTVLRSGSFEAQSLRGSGSLTMTGGWLRLHGSGSTLGRLEMHGGVLSAPQGSSAERTPGRLALGSLWWSGGQLGGAGDDRVGPEITVSGPAVLAGPSLQRGSYNGRLQFNGDTLWQDGGSTLSGDGHLSIGRGGHFHDNAATANHILNLSYGTLTIEGRYRKTGAASTFITPEAGTFINRGVLDVLGGEWRMGSANGGFTWSNEGTINVSNARMSISASSIFQAARPGTRREAGPGVVNVGEGGEVAIGGMDRARLWTVAQGGLVHFSGAATDLGASPYGGTVRNAGRVVFDSGSSAIGSTATFDSRAGAVDVVQQGRLHIARDLQVDRLRVADPYVHAENGSIMGYTFSVLRGTGGLSLRSLEWGDGYLDVTGRVTVTGDARLTNNVETWGYFAERRFGKDINGAFSFLGRTYWDGVGELIGPGSLHIGTQGSFTDDNTLGTPDRDDFGEPIRRPTRIQVAAFVNEGRYLKQGPGHTVIQGPFDHRGLLQASAGRLTLSGPVSSTGTMEAHGGSIEIIGPLAQYVAEPEQLSGSLTGGRYVVRQGAIVLNLGTDSTGVSARNIGVIGADAAVVLDGANAQLGTRVLGEEVNALTRLRQNQGELMLLNGAGLALSDASQGLINPGRLSIGAGSWLTLAGDLYQGPSGATWLGGRLSADDIYWEGGRFSAGLEGEIGVAQLAADTVRFSQAAFLLLGVDGMQAFDLYQVDGSVMLGGTLQVDFGGDAPVTGTFRFLTASAGVSGRFDSLVSSLDPARYRLTAVYGVDHVSLTVAAVPEPHTYALLLAGLGAVAVVARRRRRG